MFFTVEITTADGVTAQSIFNRGTKEQAIASFHYFLSSAMANDKCTHALCIVIDEHGGIHKLEEYIKAE